MTAIILVVAYGLAGLAYVMGDVGEPVIRQPAYAREYTQRGRRGPLLVAGALWLPFAVQRRRWGPPLVFVIAAAIGFAVAGLFA
ncbi:hypothetical protein SSBR45G_46780 [Bradyrhizobium sp. SSBR45G]|uniref:hypothetical protein n=1 Tax=unclassified Bradyrhizobium TaxID=2631580 RepID=UPI002342A549|nr:MULTISPECIES: hypothetical protein [unclassified Bradyrhizobium]GLH79769.1 hypothetical protein SSBR45G_46780 [Bradyrhizobium sp. SSBR45G]GLH87113.1 hypothetical protein SSBR45R_45730 [Bradyrhizobium sp. SSBR45R]